MPSRPPPQRISTTGRFVEYILFEGTTLSTQEICEETANIPANVKPIGRGSINRALVGLREKDIVESRPDPTDARRKLHTLRQWRREQIAERLDKAEEKSRKRRQKHPGPSFYKNRLRRLALDDGRCVSCGMSNEEHQSKYGHELHCHHVVKRNRFKPELGDNPKKAHKIENLRTLCVVCHKRWEMFSPLAPETEFKGSVND